MVAVGRISLILSNRRPQVFFFLFFFVGRFCTPFVLRWPYQQRFKWVIVNCQVFPLVLFIFIKNSQPNRHICKNQSTFFFSLSLSLFCAFPPFLPPSLSLLVEFGLAIFKEETTGGSQFWTVTRLERKRGPIRTWPSKTLQDFLLSSPEEYLQVQGATAGPLERFSPARSLALVASEGMVAAPQIHATLSECLAFFAGEHFDLWSRKDADCSSL